MKKTVPVLVLAAICALAIISCKTTKALVTDDTFHRIYNKYYNDLILEGSRTHTVKSGDTLSRISNSYYSDGYYYPVIMLASKDIVADPDKIEPGMILIIPDLQRNLNDAKAKASIKGVILDCAKLEDDRGRASTAKGLRDHANSL